MQREFVEVNVHYAYTQPNGNKILKSYDQTGIQSRNVIL